MRSVTCPDCGATVEIPVVTVGDESVVVYCKHCLWQDLDTLYGRRGLVVWGGEVAEMACWTCVPPGPGLQAAIDALGSRGGSLMLQPGTYTGNVTISNSGGDVSIIGSGWSTILTGSILVEVSSCKIRDLMVRATGQTYGIKLFRDRTKYPAGGGVARTEISNVWCGGTTVGTHDGPDKGLWFDGAILTHVRNSTFAFNNDHGLYVNTTNASDSTNVNTFYDCTFNANNEGGVTGYGVELAVGLDGVAGMSQHRFFGGNMEGNMTNDFKATESTTVMLDGVDFETTLTISNIIDISNSNPVIVQNCNFVGGSGASISRFFLFTGVENGLVRHNRLSGTTWSTAAVGVFGDGCVQCQAYGNILSAARSRAFINNRGSMRGTVA